MIELNRLRVGDFDISQSIEIDELEKNKENEIWLNNHIISLEHVMEKIPKFDLPKNKLEKFLNGVKIEANKEDGIYKVYCNGTFLGSGVVFDSKIKRDIILNKS